MQDLINFLLNHAALSLCMILIVILLIIVEFLRAKRGNLSLTPLQVTQKINHDNAVVIDIRSQDLYRQGHIIGSQRLSSQDIKQNSKKIEKFKTKPIVLVCHMGVESQKVASQLLKQGYHAYSSKGGIKAWNEAQLPLVKE